MTEYSHKEPRDSDRDDPIAFWKEEWHDMPRAMKIGIIIVAVLFVALLAHDFYVGVNTSCVIKSV